MLRGQSIGQDFGSFHWAQLLRRWVIDWPQNGHPHNGPNLSKAF